MAPMKNMMSLLMFMHREARALLYRTLLTRLRDKAPSSQPSAAAAACHSPTKGAVCVAVWFPTAYYLQNAYNSYSL